MARRNNDEHEDTATVRIPVRPPVAPPPRGYTPLKPGPLPKGRDRRETVPITKSNGGPISDQDGLDASLALTRALRLPAYAGEEIARLAAIVERWNRFGGTYAAAKSMEKIAAKLQLKKAAFVRELVPEIMPADGSAYPFRAKQNPCYTGEAVPTSQGHRHTMSCNPARPPRSAHCEYVTGPDGHELLFCVEQKRFGFAGYLYDAALDERLPVSLGNASSVEDAVANGRSFLAKLGFAVPGVPRGRPNPGGGESVPRRNPYVRPAGVGEVVSAYWTGDYGKIHYHGLGKVVRYYDSKDGPTVTVTLIEPGEDRAGRYQVPAGSKVVIPLPPHPDASPGNSIKRTSRNPWEPSRSGGKVLTYGQLPPRAAFVKAINASGPLTMDLKGNDLRAAEYAGWDGGEIDGEGMYELLEQLVVSWEMEGDAAAGDLASVFVGLAGYEWV